MDDGPDVRSAVADALTVERLPGHDRGRRAQQALSALARREPDAVVLDVMMPVLDGLAVCRRIRAIGDPHPSSSLTAPGLR
ncbi:response regulator [Streptomyces sp. KL116D]|uniref:response regulator n=1 Tax=Streptomyces sp. KL116D TaxID=3045152 RepID=UPI003555CAEC